ncbi:MAG TPA: LytTR family DNA-binding domain-containing protein [Gammaproteobacteria bacterium]|nr:LytTR family DNA-binding domain-containing protein [Gammaproteobacteria bacterium]
MKLIIVDDEPLARTRLTQLVNDLPGWQVAGEAGDGAAALNLAAQENPDVVLLDIRMPGMDGLETARHLMQLDAPPAVIFTTAYDHYAIAAFDTQAAGYLLKPVRTERLAQVLAAARRPNRAQLTALSQQLGSDAGDGLRGTRQHICARMRGELKLIPLEEILYFRAEQKYVTVRHLTGEVLIEDPLKDLEKEFAARFMRIHRNALVAVEFIRALERKTDGHTILHLRHSDDTLEVSRRLVANVRRHLKRL